MIHEEPIRWSAGGVVTDMVGPRRR